MKMSRIAIILFGAALMFSASAFAGNANRGTLHLGDTLTVDGIPLQPGDYKVEWNGNGPDVTVELLKGRDTVATFPAHLAEQSQPNDADAYGSSDEPNGGKALTAIYFGGKHYVLQVQPHAAKQQNASNQNSSPSK